MDASGLKLGQIITEPQRRDAVHIAVCPVVAGDMPIVPGSALCWADEATMRVWSVPRGHETAIGIADPYLKENVQPGERFWLFLYPGTITSLRHEWGHPAFAGHTDGVGEKKVKAEPSGNTDWAARLLRGTDPAKLDEARAKLEELLSHAQFQPTERYKVGLGPITLPEAVDMALGRTDAEERLHGVASAVGVGYASLMASLTWAADNKTPHVTFGDDINYGAFGHLVPQMWADFRTLTGKEPPCAPEETTFSCSC